MPEDNILVVGPAWVGDMVMAQTLFLQLKERRPDCQIDVLAPAWSQPLLQRMPQVRQGIVAPFARGQFAWQARRQLGQQLRAQNYQQAILCTNSWKSALVPFFAEIPKRTGWRGEWRYGLLNDVRRFDAKQYPLMVQRFMMLAFERGEEMPLEQFARPALICERVSVQASMQQHGLSAEKPVLALCPGAEFGSSKRWPEAYYAQVAEKMAQRGWQVWLFGSKNDQLVAAEIQKMSGDACIDLTGKTSLTEAVDLLSLAQAVVSNDSGLMHIAAALGRQLIVPYGSSSPDFTPPLADQVTVLQSDLACSPCFKRECPLQHHRCMKDLQPQQVLTVLQGAC
jgi:heptosyltransferase-2